MGYNYAEAFKMPVDYRPLALSALMLFKQEFPGETKVSVRIDEVKRAIVVKGTETRVYLWDELDPPTQT